MSSNLYQKNISKIYLHSFFTVFIIIIPVIVPLFEKHGLSMKNVYELQVFFSIIVALMEVPSGYFSDLFGRKATLIISGIFSGTAYTWLIFCQNFFDLLIFELLVGVAVSFFSGTNISIMYDSLKQFDETREGSTVAMGNIKFYTVLGEALAAIICSVLIIKSFDAVLYAQATVAWIPFFLALTLKEPPIERMDKKKHKENMKKILNFLFKEDKLVRYIFFNFTTWSVATYIVVWIYQKYWATESVDLKAFGPIWFSYSFLVAITSKYAHAIERRLGARRILFLVPILCIAGYLIMGFSGGVIGIATGYLFQISRGLNQVVIKDALNWRTASEYRATVNSLTSLLFRIMFIIIGPLTGLLIDRYGLNFPLKLLGVFFAIMFIILMLPMIKHLDKFHKTQKDS